MRFSSLVATALLALIASRRAEADVLYSTTDLGTSYQLQTDSNGHVSSVTNSNGSASYAFDKAPVDQINETVLGGSHAGDYTVYTMSNAAGKVGYIFADHGSLPFPILSPTFEPLLGGWATLPSDSSSLPPVVADMNIKGQVVGRSDFFGPPGQVVGESDYYGAAFSDINFKPHGLNTTQDERLGNYIDPIPGVTLTAAVKIDDLGRILAIGSDGHDYLLTPVALGPPQTVPEPTTLMLLGVVGFAIGVRSLRRRPLTRA
jgi:hypothetical protein